jgi:CRP-like cAMP-binding protein
MTAQERICDLLLELIERMDLAGLVEGGSMAAPLTQETLADATGLTPVHVNRTLQLLRREGEIVWKGNTLLIADPVRLARSIGRTPLRVSADMEPFPRRS